MKKQTKYTTEKAIIDRIDALSERMKLKSIEGDGLRKDAKEAYRKCNDEKLTEGDIRHLKSKAAEYLDKAEKCERTAFRIENITLPKMKRTLAAFRTGMLPIAGVMEDSSVVEQA